ALLAYLPSLCRHLLSEDLLLPSLATWWCGEAEGLNYAKAHLDSLAVKPAFGSPNAFPLSQADVPQSRRAAAAERTRLLEMLQTAPHQFVVQERVQVSRAPAWVQNQLRARPVLVRTFVASSGESTAVLPGGLTRVSTSVDDLAVSLQGGGGSKDTWVLASGS